jgi:cysteine-rich repeat protein
MCLAVLLGACQVTIDYAGTSYACAGDDPCPNGYACIADECRRVATPDGGGAGADGGIDGTGGPPRCGDLVVNVLGEECDDGDEDDSDGCIDCRFATCGDGHLRDSIEDCDDANTLDGDACPATCMACDGTTWGEHCYTITATSGTWFDGQAACEAAGGHLATLTTSEEHAAAGAYTGVSEVWIGLHDQWEGYYEWENGEPYSFTTGWTPLQPDNGGGLGQEDCAELTPYGWNDQSCATVEAALCEREPWVIRPEDNHAYRVLWMSTTYDEAEAACGLLGGHLATIGTSEEQAFLTGALAVEVGIGLSRAATGSWAWITGEPLAYTNWRPGEPDNMPTGSDCAVMRDDGDWSDKKCDDVRALCEVD